MNARADREQHQLLIEPESIIMFTDQDHRPPSDPAADRTPSS
jgi:hypothetical protein